MAKLERKIALVTGASSGIGQAAAERLARAGYKVYGTSRQWAQPGQRSFEMLTLDVTNDASVEAAVGEVIRLEGRIDLLVNIASLPAEYRSFGRSAFAALSTTSATTLGSSPVAITSLSTLPKAARASRYSSTFELGSSKFVSNCVFVYAGSMTATLIPLVRSSWSSDSE